MRSGLNPMHNQAITDTFINPASFSLFLGVRGNMNVLNTLPAVAGGYGYCRSCRTIRSAASPTEARSGKSYSEVS